MHASTHTHTESDNAQEQTIPFKGTLLITFFHRLSQLPKFLQIPINPRAR